MVRRRMENRVKLQAVLAGIVIIYSFELIISLLGAYIFIEPGTPRPKSPGEQPLEILGTILVAHLVGIALGTNMAKRLDSERSARFTSAMGVGGVIVSLFTGGFSTWFIVADIAVSIAGAFAGLRLGAPQRTSS